jgi:uncharacterized protein YvpB
MKKVLIVAIVVVAVLVGIGFITRQPTLIYLSRQAQVKIARQGWVAGENIYQLGVPWHRQEHSLSCEVASLKMALDYSGVNVPESELISYLTFDPTPKRGNVWGDPYQGFVGSIDGSMLKTGYGVYWEPIARLGLRYRRTEVIKDGTLQSLITHLEQGRPVVVWGHFGNAGMMTWRTPEGRVIEGINGEHARTLVGFTGDSRNPESVILLDPIYGELRWTVDYFMRNWGNLEHGAVAVYPFPRWASVEGDPTIWEIGADGKTKYGLAMSWSDFLAQGGVPEAINVVDAQWLSGLQSEEIFSLPPV